MQSQGRTTVSQHTETYMKNKLKQAVKSKIETQRIFNEHTKFVDYIEDFNSEKGSSKKPAESKLYKHLARSLSTHLNPGRSTYALLDMHNFEKRSDKKSESPLKSLLSVHTSDLK